MYLCKKGQNVLETSSNVSLAAKSVSLLILKPFDQMHPPPTASVAQTTTTDLLDSLTYAYIPKLVTQMRSAGNDTFDMEGINGKEKLATIFC